MTIVMIGTIVAITNTINTVGETRSLKWQLWRYGFPMATRWHRRLSRLLKEHTRLFHSTVVWFLIRQTWDKVDNWVCSATISYQRMRGGGGAFWKNLYGSQLIKWSDIYYRYTADVAKMNVHLSSCRPFCPFRGLATRFILDQFPHHALHVSHMIIEIWIMKYTNLASTNKTTMWFVLSCE